MSCQAARATGHGRAQPRPGLARGDGALCKSYRPWRVECPALPCTALQRRLSDLVSLDQQPRCVLLEHCVLGDFSKVCGFQAARVRTAPS